MTGVVYERIVSPADGTKPEDKLTVVATKEVNGYAVWLIGAMSYVCCKHTFVSMHDYRSDAIEAAVRLALKMIEDNQKESAK